MKKTTKNNLYEYFMGLIYDNYCSAIFFSVSNENLYEYTNINDNIVYKLTGFSGDTGSILITNKKTYLYVDGRFTIQAKRETKNKNIIVLEINRYENICNDILKRINEGDKILLDYKRISIEKYNDLYEKLESKNIRFIYNEKVINKAFNLKNDYENDIFILDNKYISKTPKQKIKDLIRNIASDGYSCYITSSLEEIAYLTNIRKYESEKGNKILLTAFMIVSQNKSYLYTKEKLSLNILKYLKKNNIDIKAYNDFYNDIIKYKNISYGIDESLNNYFIFKKIKLSKKNDKHLIKSPLTHIMSIKGDKEIKGLKYCNILDGVAITKSIYKIKKLINEGEKLTEYDIKNIVDEGRKLVKKDYYIGKSFDTIVAYKENSAICHYAPSELDSKKVYQNGLLLIDSGGNYKCGTTDITRTISLYKKNIPKIIKKHYTLVLNSLVKLSIQKFPYGITGSEIDIVSRQNLYNNYLDFRHGTGHGIGYISNVHEGPNRIGPGITKNYKSNVLEPSQVTSNEPGLYFENKYGIRLENDLLTIFDRETAYGDFLKFETLTLCPFERDLIDEDILTDESIIFLNKYNESVYKKIYKYLSKEEKQMLKYDTKQFPKRRRV